MRKTGGLASALIVPKIPRNILGGASVGPSTPEGTHMMRAATYPRYGAPGVIEVRDVPKPSVGEREILIRVRATCVNSADCRMRSLLVPRGFAGLTRLALGVFGPRRPVLGTDLAGVVEAVGAEVTHFREGDEVFADTGARVGAHAEYKKMRADEAIVRKPGKLSFPDAAALVFGGATALGFLRDKATLAPGESVLINGASGAVGCAAVQLAKHLGAKVTTVCSAANTALMSSLGADHVIDYAVHDFTRGDGRYDVIMDNVGNAPWAKTKNVLKPRGRLLCVVATLPQMIGALFPKREGKKVICGVVTADAAMLQFMADLAEAGQYTPVIDRSYDLEEIAEAHAYCDTGRKRGSVMVEVGTTMGAR